MIIDYQVTGVMDPEISKRKTRAQRLLDGDVSEAQGLNDGFAS